MFKSRLVFIGTCLICVGIFFPCQAALKLPHFLSSHMVLQRDKAVQIWGTALPDEKVTVQLHGQSVSTITGADGKWLVHLKPMQANASPGALVIRTDGGEKIELEDILVGEVWIGSGQSNMRATHTSLKLPKKLLAKANRPQIRLLKIALNNTPMPLDDAQGTWTVCSPETAADFSAVLFHFACTVQDKINVPIGLIDSAWGGTRIEPWIAPQGYHFIPGIKDRLVKEKNRATREYKKNAHMLAEYERWVKAAKTAHKEKRYAGRPPAWRRPKTHQFMTCIYNAMIHPLAPMRIRGVLWYQGESNRGAGADYVNMMKALVHGWREVFQQGEFPFYFVQLASYRYPNVPFALAEIRESQLRCITQIPHTGMAVTVDISDLNDIHPKNKQDVGKRLALWALAKDYGFKDLVYSGPLYDRFEVQGNAIRIHFKHVGKGLVSRDGKPLSWFTIAGQDKEFVQATAVIEGDTVLVQSQTVAKPLFVRFGWHQLAEPNLSNREGLPASPFRTGI